MILKELLEVLNANVYFHLFKEKHIGRFDKYDIGVSNYLLDYVKEINKLLYEIAVIIGTREYEVELTQDGWGIAPDGKNLEKIPSIEIKIIDYLKSKGK